MQLFTFTISSIFVAGVLAAPHWRRGNSTVCKCTPDDPCWPAASRWKAVSQAAQGRLASVTPAAAACYPAFGNVSTANTAQCDAIQANWTSANWIVDQPVQGFTTFWSNNSCNVDAKCGHTCGLGLSPQMVVTANNQFDVQVSVNFARIQNVRLVIRNTGHDYLGRSSGYGSLALNTHRLSTIEFTKAYTGPGNYSGGAVKAGAGVMFGQLYPAAKAEGVDVVGGDSLTVGIAGGYLQGGGHSPLSGLYGMGADNVLSYDAVLASGAKVQINAGSYPDLFWALKGGGPSNYAAITAVTVKTHPAVPCTGATLNITYNQPNFWKAFAAFHDSANAFVDAGLYVAYTVSQASGLRVQPFVAPNTTVDDFNRTLAPFLAQLASLRLTYTMDQPTSYPTFYDLYRALFPLTDDAGGTNALLGGRLLSKDDVSKNGATINSAIQGLVEAGHPFTGHMVNPGHAVPDPDASVSAVHPVWRKAADCGMWSYEPPECLSEEGRQQALQNVTRMGEPLRKASPSSAAYVNECDINEPDWQETFWGANYKKLYDIKTKYDPDGVFWTQSTPGSELWRLQDETRLCKA